MVVGRIFHYTVDLVLVSAFLAGVRRNSGLTINFDSTQNKDLQYYGGKYLDMGESILDYTVAYCSSSAYFKRK
ncbi:hypothetical protein PSN45_001992 [Yamadazyma tenuis]|uniref:DUF1748-domain-containing protein n=1 Tax=Candida tenuis (strain ATCC 10573 / BCRC 21748 / CBS 615 / JCM 9827 / NBRC 10315 / NRRL Y-1498 / VKM Y-70) TaxID=590646 RepID=G3BD70_CANTC|nr:uncharacterized protein CANTEDRAFT_127317 [Yamadazyma tenuis ATCC 10573]EGV60255.1 hypothetical protein CANTEDRAFT_127317 [Yamadazyma tenuis ATCC 10573]WEJ94503.1 hypothetical protein PSN45_001992 [Yamadazyma tenuis]